MKYYKYPNPYITDDEIATDYIEVDDEHYSVRQLSIFKSGATESSNVDLMLGDQPFDYEKDKDDYDYPITPITADEFNAVWQKHLQQHAARWIETKKLFPINKPVTGCMKTFFPQGIIVQLDQNALGVTDYWQARATATSQFSMVIGYQITGAVTGYDETNQWIKLGSPQIDVDKPCNPHNWGSPA